jgi:RNA-directed DNA polymerase
VNSDAPWPDLDEAEWRVLKIQTKLHQWAIDDPDRRFDDLFNLVADPAFLVVAWNRVHKNRGARSAGVDGVAPRSIIFGTEVFLAELRDDLKARRFVPVPVREKLIPKKGGKFRGLGIPTARDRTVQGALKLVLEPILEADFQPCSYGSAPGAEPRTPSRRFSSTPPTPTSGCWKETSNRASTRFRMSVSWTGCGTGSGTSVFWPW